MSFVQLSGGNGRKVIHVDDVNLRRSLDAVCRVAVGRHVERLVGILRVVKIIRNSELVCRVDIPVEAAESRRVTNGMLYRLAVVLSHAVLQEVQEGHPLAFAAGADHGVVGAHDWIRHRTSGPKRRAQIGTGQVGKNLFKRSENENFVLDDRTADRSTKLVAAKVLERFAIRGSRCQRFRAEIFEAASVHLVRSRLCDDVDDASRSAPEFRVGSAGDNLEFLDRVQRDINRRALSAELFSEEAVVVVTPIEADVIEDAALTIEVNFIAIRTLRYGHTGRQCQQVFKFAPQHRRPADRELAQGRGRFRFCCFDYRNVGDDDLLRDRRNLERDWDRERLSDRQVHVLLQYTGESLFADG